MPITSKSANVRIIGGEWNGRKIPFRTDSRLRPSTGRVREALFSCLGHNLKDWSCLDLFAGTGVLGFSAASRGAHQVTMVEKNSKQVDSLRTMVSLLQAPIEVFKMTAHHFLVKTEKKYDLVFLDPPYCTMQKEWDQLFSLLIPKLNPAAQVYCESNHALVLPMGMEIKTKRRIGDVFWQIGIWRWNDETQ